MKWFERRFAFDAPVGIFPSLLERIRGTPARVEERVRGAAREVLIAHPKPGWSIQEHIGHLGDLEELWADRVEDILRGAEVMQAADLTNRRTNEAGHDDTPVADLLAGFRAQRASWVTRLEALDDLDVARTSLHPRLKEPMRIIDLVLFVAEHDDHHLAHISGLLRDLGEAAPSRR